jgi:Short C-terminal domain
MGLFGGMKDPVRGTARVVAASQLLSRATWANCSMNLVIEAEGLQPYSLEHTSLLTPTSKWPHAGMVLPVTVDRRKPDKIKIHWEDVQSGDDWAEAQAEALAAQLRGGQDMGETTVLTGSPETAELVERLKQMFPGATVNVQSSTDVVGDPETAAKVQQALSMFQQIEPGAASAAPAARPTDTSIEAWEKRLGIDVNADGAVGDNDPAGGRLDHLERLSKLRKDGVLTEEEFQAEKKRILGSP